MLVFFPSVMYPKNKFNLITKPKKCICFYVLQSSPLEKGLSQQELFEALSGQKLKTPEGSKHKSKGQGDGGHGQSSDADSDVKVTTPEQVESR